MEKINGNDPVYPSGASFDSEGRECNTGFPGLTIRQEFAKAAMQAYATKGGMGDFKSVAEASVLQADALIAALNK